MNGLAKVVGGTLRILKQEAPKILTGLGIVGCVAAGCYAVKNTPAAQEAIKERKEELNVDKLPPKELVRTTWRYYIGPIVIEILSVSEILLANCINAKRYSTLATLYVGSEKLMEKYQNKVIETIGEKKEEKIRESILEDESRNISDEAGVILTEYGSVLFFDKYCGRTFRCSVSQLEKACLEISRKSYVYDTVTLNRLYECIGLPTADLGEWFIWDIEDIRKESDGLMFKPRYVRHGPEPMGLVEFNIEPKIDKFRLRY